jgi:MoxR-like ATPase
MQQKLLKLQQSLSQSLIGRDEAVKSALLALIAKENVLLIGPPGTAKSMLARRISQALTPSDHAYFEYLLTKFSTPEEIFGPLSISELKQDRFKRNTDGYLPTVQVAFLDEIFKASSSILNALLTILNERKYHNGTASTDVPLLSLIAASNELPTGQAELSALYDRFLIRRFVDYVGQDELAKFFDVMPHAVTPTYLSSDDINAIHQKAQTVTFPDDVKQAIQQIWAAHADAFKENADERLSDRRFVKVLNLMRISAVTNDRTEVDFSDVLLLKDCLWDNPENRDKVREIINEVLQKSDRPSIDTDKEIMPITPITIKGMQGSGTKDDPILIETVQHLKRLKNPNIGQQGYYFKQTQDIDCSNIDKSSWFNINFKGFYNGNNKNITYYKINDWCIFNSITDSEFININLEALFLSKNANNSKFMHCRTLKSGLIFQDKKNNSATSCQFFECDVDHTISEKMKYCQVKLCKAQYIANDIENSNISLCCTKSVLVRFTVIDSKISDCQILLKNNISNTDTHTGRFAGGIAYSIKDSTIKRCFISGEVIPENSTKLYFHGIARSINDSIISSNAIGYINEKKTHSSNMIIGSRSGSENLIEKNIVLDISNEKFSDNISSGESLSPDLFTQHYFKHNLGWDFDNIWQWNNNRNEPELRFISDINHSSIQPTQNQESLLIKQLNANIWL